MLSGSLPIGAPAGGDDRLAGMTRVAFDTREAGLDERPAIVKLNAAEAAHATSTDTAGRAGAIAAAAALHERTGGAAIVTRGADGAVMVTRTAAGSRVGSTHGGRIPSAAETRSSLASSSRSTAAPGGPRRWRLGLAQARPTPSSPGRGGSTEFEPRSSPRTRP